MPREIIGTITLTPETVAPGHSVFVEVTGPNREPYPIEGETIVRINGIIGAQQYLQFDRPGNQMIFVAAARGNKVETATANLQVSGSDTPAAVLGGDGPQIMTQPRMFNRAPLLQIAHSPHQPYSVTLTLRGGTFRRPPVGTAPRPRDRPPSHDLPGSGFSDFEEESTDPVYHWDFGDGTTRATVLPMVEHDFEPSLDPNQEHHSFDIKVRVEQFGSQIAQVARTLYVHNAYALCKRLGTIVPKVQSMTFATKALDGWEGTATIGNVEAFPLVLTSRVVQPMLPDGDDLTIPGPEERLPSPIVVPAKGSVVVSVAVPRTAVPKGAIGFAVTFCGNTESGKSIRVEVCFDLTAKDRASNAIKIGDLSAAHLPELRAAIQRLVAPLERQPGDAHGPAPTELPSNLALLIRLARQPGIIEPASSDPLTFGALAAHLRESGLLGSETLFKQETAPAPVEGEPCDPDNAPDEVADDPDTDWVCQATPEQLEKPTEARFLNARKGDIVLVPGGNNVIGNMLQQVTPAQRYSHCGIMTRNYDQITHSTAKMERILDYPIGGVPVPFGEVIPAPTEGYRPDVVKYGWPGVVTQSVEEAVDGELMPDPETGKQHSISAFSGDAVRKKMGGTWEVVLPMVIKPDPVLEGKDPTTRRKLHAVANDALAQKGKSHYRFYCYTDPTIADDSSRVGPADSGWAAGTWPSVCSSFIWQILKKRSIHLEGDGAFVTNADLEASDRHPDVGAEVSPNTRDGLYLYTAEERRAAGDYLYQFVAKQVQDHLKETAGPLADLVDLITDMSDDVANQIVNTFASDFTEQEAADSEAWKNTVPASAVSPDNMLLWDSPEAKGLYGFAAPLIYRERRVEKVRVHKWHKVRIKGTVTGTVRFKGQPQPQVIVQLYDGKTAVTDEQGNYRLEHVPFGEYEVKAFTDVDGVYLSAKVFFSINEATRQIDIDLEGPDPRFRKLAIDATLGIFDEHFKGESPHNQETHLRALRLGPAESGTMTQGEVVVETSTDEGENVAKVRVIANWNSDRSLTIYAEFSMLDDGELFDTSETFNLPARPPHLASRKWTPRIDNGDDHAWAVVTLTNEVNPH